MAMGLRLSNKKGAAYLYFEVAAPLFVRFIKSAIENRDFRRHPNRAWMAVVPNPVFT